MFVVFDHLFGYYCKKPYLKLLFILSDVKIWAFNCYRFKSMFWTFGCVRRCLVICFCLCNKLKVTVDWCSWWDCVQSFYLSTLSFFSLNAMICGSPAYSWIFSYLTFFTSVNLTAGQDMEWKSPWNSSILIQSNLSAWHFCTFIIC